MTETFVTPSTHPGTASRVLDVKLADLNALTQQVCSRLRERFSQAGAIIRCDDLPPAIADDNELYWVFEQAVNMILNNALSGNKLLIHIKSTPSMTDFVYIDICTNGKLGPAWEDQQVPLLEQCHSLCQKNGGTFIHNASHKGTQLFSIVLPAKQNIISLG